MNINTQTELIILGDVRILLKDVVMYKPDYTINILTVCVKDITNKVYFRYSSKEQLDKTLKILDIVFSGRQIIQGTESVKSNICVDGVEIAEIDYIISYENLK